MASPHRPDAGLRPFVLLILVGYFFILIAWLNRPNSDLQSYKAANLPFGCIPSPHEGYAVQDFACNLLYFHGIQDRLVAHPYQQADQEQLIHHWLPTAASGMCHAYSPVTYVLAQPLLYLPAAQAYIAYSIVCALGLIALYGLYLLPRATSRYQTYSLIICAINITVVTAFAVGQSALLTTSLLGAFWYFLQKRAQRSFTGTDIVLALLFWALCMKPSIAVIPLALLLGTRAWSALAMGGALLALTWAGLGNLYGGWWNGLHDYSLLLNHYYEDAMIPFMRAVFARHGDTGMNAYFCTLFPGHSFLFFTLSRLLFLTTTATLLALRLTNRLTPSAHFQGMVWNFLLLCPYLLPAEDCVLCLLIVEGAFFRPTSVLQGVTKLFLMLALMNLRAGLTFPIQINFPLKCVLLTWIIIEAARSVSGSRARPETGLT